MNTMQITVTNLSGLEYRLDIVVPAELIKQKTDKQLDKIALQAKMPGFRPGKVPRELIGRNYHDSARVEVVRDVVRDSYADAVRQHKLHPIDHPTIELKSADNEGDCAFSAVLEVYPEIELGDFKELSIEKCMSKIEEEHLDDALARIRKSNVEWEEVSDESYKSRKGDQLEIDFTMTPLTDNGNGEVAEAKEEKGAVIVLGDGVTWHEFEQHLYDIGSHSEKEYELTMPSTHTDKTLADKRVKFAVKVNKINRPILPELNDEFASKLLGDGKTLDELRADVRSHMEKELAQVLKNRLKDEVMDRLYTAYNSVLIPKKFLEQELNRQEEIWKERQESIAKENSSAIPEFPREKFTDSAKRNVVLGLLFNQIVSEHRLEVDPDEIYERAEELVFSYYHDDDTALVKKLLKNERFCNKIESDLLEEKIVDYLASQASIVEKFVDYNGLVDRV